MVVSTTFGPLIEMGTIDDAIYELRGEDRPVLYVYRKVGGHYFEKSTQLGGMTAEQLALLLLAELPAK